MPYKVFADLVVTLHALWVFGVVFGLLLVLRWPRFKPYHLGMLGFTFLIQLSPWYCPLTYLENWLRARHDPRLVYPGSFIPTYLEQVIYVEVSEGTITLLTAGLVALCLYVYLWRRPRGEKA